MTPLLEFKLIDVLNWKGVDYKNEEYQVREALFDEIVSTLKPYIGISRIPIEKNSINKMKFHDGILARKGEGSVAVNITSKYVASKNRQKGAYVKIKKTVSKNLDLQGMGDTIDGFITGFKPATVGKGFEGQVGALEISCFVVGSNGKKEQRVIAFVPGLSNELRRELSVKGLSGELELNKEYIGKVVEVDGQGFSAKSQRLTHPRMIGFRPDKGPDDCVLTEDFIINSIA